MSTPDIIILLCLIPGIIDGARKGLIHQVLALASVIIGTWIAFHFSEIVCIFLQPYLPGVSGMILNVISFILLLCVVAVLFFLVGKMIKSLMKAICLGWMDWVFGILFAILKSALVIGIVIMLYDTLNLRFEFADSETLDSSLLYKPLKTFAYTVFPYFKALLFKQ